MHLRHDRPERSDRLARWVDTLEPEDTLYLVGDVCDFWLAARENRFDPLALAGLKSLAEFRGRGGSLAILPGNHDQWLGRAYEDVLGARFLTEPLVVEAHGVRVHLVHGHRVGGRPPWKAGMESRAFLRVFRRAPTSVADELDRRLDSRNEAGRARDERRVVPIFRRYAEGLGGVADVAVFGHIHTPIDDASMTPRFVILGSWHTQTSYLKLDDQGARLVITPDNAAVPT